jgi:hypothetical protein
MLLREVAVTSSAAGLVWSLGVADGARVSRGDVLGEFADCSRTYVEATLPERGFAVVRLGATVRVRLSSGTAELPGTVRSLHGAGAAGTTSYARRRSSRERADDGGGGCGSGGARQALCGCLPTRPLLEGLLGIAPQQLEETIRLIAQSRTG